MEKKKSRVTVPDEQPGTTVFNSALGWILLTWQNGELTRISFGHPSPAAAAKQAAAEPIALDDVPAWIAQLVDKIQKFAEGKKVNWGKIPLATSEQTEFQRKVRAACQQIPRGQVLSYAELAAAAGSPKAARAVGSVMRTNPFPLIIPCHRVVGAGKTLGGFSCPSGVVMKQQLLAAEGVTLRAKAASRTQPSLSGGHRPKKS